MRLAFTIALLLVGVAAARSAEIRQFDHRTTEKLGNQLVAANKRADHGATTPEKQRAKQTAVAALEGKLFDELRYEYVVLDDPAGGGFLVYALGKARRKGDVITGGHLRVPLSADGSVAGQIDLLSQLIHHSADSGHTIAAIAATQSAGELPPKRGSIPATCTNSRCTSQ